jgi:hypothetical protein
MSRARSPNTFAAWAARPIVSSAVARQWREKPAAGNVAAELAVARAHWYEAEDAAAAAAAEAAAAEGEAKETDPQ